jgi:DNA-binding HxlR family transcriptional regulator
LQSNARPSVPGFLFGTAIMRTERQKNLRSLCKEPTLRILAMLSRGPATFPVIERALESSNSRISREHFQKLARDGMTERVVASIEPIVIQHCLTPMGAELAKHAAALVDWLDGHRDEVEAARERHKAHDRAEVIEQ